MCFCACAFIGNVIIFHLSRERELQQHTFNRMYYSDPHNNAQISCFNPSRSYKEKVGHTWRKERKCIITNYNQITQLLLNKSNEYWPSFNNCFAGSDPRSMEGHLLIFKSTSQKLEGIQKQHMMLRPVPAFPHNMLP